MTRQRARCPNARSVEPIGACGWSLDRRPTVDHPSKLRREE
jgi:hypothetical protein